MRSLAVIAVESCLGINTLPDSIDLRSMTGSSAFRKVFDDNCIEANISLIQPGKNTLPGAQRLAALIRELASLTGRAVQQQQAFLVMGGDHSCAMGTWQGVLANMPAGKRFGLLWLDAHLDAHSFVTSPSGNVHGMPVAALLGKGDPLLQQIYGATDYLSAGELVLLAARSYEQDEKQLLNTAGIRVIDKHDCQQAGGFSSQFEQAVEHLLQHCDYLGISVDLDVIDPRDAHAVATPVADGIRANELIAAFAYVDVGKRLLGVEIAEYIPALDTAQKTQTSILGLCSALLSHWPSA